MSSTICFGCSKTFFAYNREYDKHFKPLYICPYCNHIGRLNYINGKPPYWILNNDFIKRQQNISWI